MVSYPFMEQSYLLNVTYCRLIYDLADMLQKNTISSQMQNFLAKGNALTLLIFTLLPSNTQWLQGQQISALKTSLFHQRFGNIWQTLSLETHLVLKVKSTRVYIHKYSQDWMCLEPETQTKDNSVPRDSIQTVPFRVLTLKVALVTHRGVTRILRRPKTFSYEEQLRKLVLFGVIWYIYF